MKTYQDQSEDGEREAYALFIRSGRRGEEVKFPLLINDRKAITSSYRTHAVSLNEGDFAHAEGERGGWGRFDVSRIL